MLSTLKKALDLTNEMVLITDDKVHPSEVNILYANQAFTNFTGYTREELDSLISVQVENIEPKVMEQYIQARRSKKYFRDYMPGQKKDGEMFWVDLTLTPYYEEENQEWYFIHQPRLTREQEMINKRANELGWDEIIQSMANLCLWEWYPDTDRVFLVEKQLRDSWSGKKRSHPELSDVSGSLD